MAKIYYIVQILYKNILYLDIHCHESRKIMARAIWKGFISFGLVAIPVSLIPAEEKNEIHFHLIDARNKSRVHYQRINDQTGKEVAWADVVKGYEVDKNDYVILDEEDFQKVRPDTFKSIEINEFVDIKKIDFMYFEKPYYLIPDSQNKKSYVLLREALKKTNKVGVGKVIIRTKEYLSLIAAHDKALVLNLIRFSENLRKEEDLPLPTEAPKNYHISPRELKMATDLIEKMTAAWDPEQYHDDYKEALRKWIEKKTKYHVTPPVHQKTKRKDDVVDFVALLKKSMEGKKRVVRKHKKKS